MTIRNPEHYVEQLAEERWQAFDKALDVQVDGFDDQEINRMIENIAVGEGDTVDDVLEFIRDYTSVKNYQSGVTQKYAYVDDPMCQGHVHEGRFRQAFTRVKYKSQGDLVSVIQTLRKGFVTSLAKEDDDLVDWTKGRLADQNKAFSTEHYVTIQFPNIASTKVNEIVTYLDGLDVSSFNPVIRDEAIGTGMHRLAVVSKQQDDASHVITMFLADPQVTYEGYRDYETYKQQDITYHDSVPKNLYDGIIEAYKATGRSAVGTYNPQTKLHKIVLSEKADVSESILDAVTFVNCDRYKLTSYYWGISKEELEALENAIPSEPDRGKTYIIDTIGNNGDGTYNFVFSIWIRNKRVYADQRVETSTGSQTERGKILGSVDDADIPDIDTTVRGTAKRQRIQIKDDCSKDIITDTTVIQEIDFARKQVRNTGLETGHETVRTGLDSDSDVTDISADTSAGQAKSLRLSHDPNTGVITESLIEQQEVPATVTDGDTVEDSSALSIDETSKLNQTTAPEPVSADVGTRVVQTIRMTANKAFNYVKRVITRKNQSVTRTITQRGDYSESLERQQGAVSAPTDLSAVNGQIQSVVGLNVDEFGRYNYNKNTITAKSQNSKVLFKQQLRDRVVETDTNASAQLTVPTGIADGITKINRSQSNSFPGRWNNTEEEISVTKRLYSRKSFSTRYGTGYFTICKYGKEADLDNALTSLSSSRMNSISANINDDGTVNFIIIENPYSSSGSETFYDAAKFQLTILVPVTNGAIGSYRTYVYNIEISYHASKQSAYNKIDGGVKGSNVRQVTPILWESYFIKGLSIDGEVIGDMS